jgi:hypothetical protein
MNKNFILLVLALMIAISPFIIHDSNDGINSLVLSDSTIGNYQSTTCKISLSEFYLKNRSEDLDIYYNNNNYADVNCFGKIAGVDKVGQKYYVSVGTNSSANLILQSTVWILIMLIIPKSKDYMKFSIIPVVVLPWVILLQFIGENRFYSSNNILFDNALSPNNYYFLLILLNMGLLFAVFNELLSTRFKELINYFPLIFLFPASYTGNNLNIYFILGSFLGAQQLIASARDSSKTFSFFDYSYFLFSIFWISNSSSENYYFDTDKLRGFINSSTTTTSKLYWIVMFYLFVKGVFYVFKLSKQSINFSKIKNSFFISGSLIVVFGYLGAISPIINFFNMLFFGQNKRGMKVFSSIEGNTWRGFSPSAESVGEFFGFIIIFYLLYLIEKKGTFKITDLFFLLPIVYGLYRSNNFAVIISISSLFVYIFYKYYLKKLLKNLPSSKYISITVIFLSLIAGFLFLKNDYPYLSTELLYEATLHQNFFSFESDFKNYLSVEQKMIERDLITLLTLDNNFEKASSAYLMLVSIFTQSINIPFIPNIVALVSIVAFYINRTEMWGIFIAKYNPNLLEGIFGYGPFSMNEYLFGHKIRLDVPTYELEGLFLPHSSLFDILIFFGLAGTILFSLPVIGVLKNTLFDNSNTKLLLIFLIINMLKSDSILYLNSFILLLFAYSITKEGSSLELSS